jgi:hypothetical protein
MDGMRSQNCALLSNTGLSSVKPCPCGPLAPGHGGVGSGPPAWELEELRHAGDVEAGYHDPNSYIKMESRPYLGDDKVSSPAVKLGVPKRPQRPNTGVLNPLVGTSFHLSVTNLILTGFQ